MTDNLNQHIEYARTADGVSIAYSTMGAGPPVVFVPPAPFMHLQMELRIPEHRRWHERLASRRTLVRFDSRGHGLSAHGPVRYALDPLVLDLEAVVDRLGFERFALIAVYHAGPVALAYAARHQPRVSRIVLWESAPDVSEYVTQPPMQGLLSLIDKDWELFTESTASAWLGWSLGESARRFAEMIRGAATQDTMAAWVDGLSRMDISALLPQVMAPTLALHNSGPDAPPLEWSSALAAQIPNGRLALIEREAPSPFVGDVEQVLSTIERFLDEDDPATSAAFQRREPEPVVISPSPDGLTPREVEILQLVARGESNKEIAMRLSLSVNTVERHVANIYRKISARGRADATAYALQRGLG